MCNIAKNKYNTFMNPKRLRALRKAQRQIPQGQQLYTLADGLFLDDDYGRFMAFCKRTYPSINEESKVSSATFERLVEEFKQEKEMAY